MSDGETVLCVGTLNAIKALHPRRSADLVSHLVISQVYESPFRRAGAEGVAPALFASLESQDPQGKVRVARLREGACFSDGSPVTPDDVVQSLREADRVLGGVEITTSGDDIRLELAAPRAGFEHALAQRSCAIVRRKGDELVGTGPFAVESIGEREVHLVRNPHAERKAGVDRIVVRAYPPGPGGGLDDLVAAVESGEVHFTMALSRDAVAGVTKARKLFSPGWSTAALFMNTEREYFADAEVRRGLAAAVDRYRLTEVCYENPAGFAARGVLPPRMGRANDGIRFDPNAAAAAKGRLPDVLKLLTVWGPRPYLPKPDAVAAMLGEQLGVLGTRLEVRRTRDADDYFGSLRDEDYDLVLGGWMADEPDAVDFLNSLLSTEMIPIPGRDTALTCNLARWSNPEVDRLLTAARRDPASVDIQDILRHVADQVPFVPLMYGPTVIVHGWNVAGFDPDRDLVPDLSRLELG